MFNVACSALLLTRYGGQMPTKFVVADVVTEFAHGQYPNLFPVSHPFYRIDLG
jgi:hypothetical protein